MALPELDVKSVFDVVEENFQRLGLKAYAIRMIYIGEHTLSKNELIQHFEKTINGVNAGYCEIHVSGLLLVYDSYFVHIIEGSEDTVHRQLRFLFQNEVSWIAKIKKLDEESALRDAAERREEVRTPELPITPERRIFKRLKLLMVYHSIQTMLFNGWRAVTARPPSLVGKLDVHRPLAEHMEQLRICLDKISKLCNLAKMDDTLSFEGLSAVDPKIEALPEVTLLDYLIQSPHILHLRQTAYMHRRVDDYVFYFESVWPLPTHFTPKLLYKLKIDDSFVEPLPAMPWEVKEKAEDDEKEEEEQCGSSSSD